LLGGLVLDRLPRCQLGFYRRLQGKHQSVKPIEFFACRLEWTGEPPPAMLEKQGGPEVAEVIPLTIIKRLYDTSDDPIVRTQFAKLFKNPQCLATA